MDISESNKEKRLRILAALLHGYITGSADAAPFSGKNASQILQEGRRAIHSKRERLEINRERAKRMLERIRQENPGLNEKEIMHRFYDKQGKLRDSLVFFDQTGLSSL